MKSGSPNEQPARPHESSDSSSKESEHAAHAQNEATNEKTADVAQRVKAQRQERKNREEGKPTSTTETYGYRPELVDGDQQLIPGWNKDRAIQENLRKSEETDKNDKIIEYEPHQISPTEFALGLDYEESKKNKSEGSLTDVANKIIGVEEGVSQAAREGIQNWAKDPNAVNKAIIAAGEAISVAAEYYTNKISSADINGFVGDLAQTGEAIKDASNAYSELSPKEQGRIIGHDFMPAFLPDAPGIFSEIKALGNTPEVVKATKALSEKFDIATGSVKRSPGELEHYLEKLPPEVLQAKMPQDIHERLDWIPASNSREAGRAIDRMYHPGKNASTEFIDEVYKALNTLPAEDIKAVEQAGWRIRADKTIADIDRRIARYKEVPTDSSNEYSLGLTVPKDTPRSQWPGDKTKHPEIMLPEYAKSPEGSWLSQMEIDTADYVTRHEFGHAYVETKGLERNPMLFHLYRICRNNAANEWIEFAEQATPLSLEQRERLKELTSIGYYIDDKSGFSETLAELYAIDHGGLQYAFQSSLANTFKPLLDNLRNEKWYRARNQ